MNSASVLVPVEPSSCPTTKSVRPYRVATCCCRSVRMAQSSDRAQGSQLSCYRSIGMAELCKTACFVCCSVVALLRRHLNEVSRHCLAVEPFGVFDDAEEANFVDDDEDDCFVYLLLLLDR